MQSTTLSQASALALNFNEGQDKSFYHFFIKAYLLYGLKNKSIHPPNI
ncbi:hypothetical protein HDF25_005194 [Pedobacter cryoconitis]|uniref:Uncharacterized protein n=1 Tax=Pedobacter cryoconitis TaxID=188932 RepID=A0A7X0J8H6_9SPHI|nr:hypothetical protein [Pedobacter cryoconitis]